MPWNGERNRFSKTYYVYFQIPFNIVYISAYLCYWLYYRTIKTKTGEWHRDLVRKKCQGKSLDVSSTLYRRISIDLINNDARRFSSASRSSLCSSPSSSRPSTNSRMSSYEDRSSEVNEGWGEDVIDGSSFKSTQADAQKQINKQENTTVVDSLSQNIQQVNLKQRDIWLWIFLGTYKLSNFFDSLKGINLRVSGQMQFAKNKIKMGFFNKKKNFFKWQLVILNYSQKKSLHTLLNVQGIYVNFYPRYVTCLWNHI